MAGLPGAVHYALASSLRRTQKVLSGLATQPLPPTHTPIALAAAGGRAAANALETQGRGAGGRGRRQSRVGLEGEWERIKVPWIRLFELSSPAPSPSFAPGCDLPKATTHSPLLPTWWGPQKYLETDQSRVSSCWAVLLSFPERGAGRDFQMLPVPGVVCLRKGPAGVEELTWT